MYSVLFKYIRLPGWNELNFLDIGFKSFANFPGTKLATYGTYIRIAAPSQSPNICYNRNPL